QMGEMAALNQFMEWKIFDLIADHGSISYYELAQKIQADESLVSRIGRILVSTGHLVQPRPGHVAHSNLSHIFKSESPPGNLFRTMFDHGLRGFTHWQDYFVEYKNREPLDVTHNPLTFSWGYPAKTIWEVVDMEPERARVFSMDMKAMASLTSIYGGPADVYDFGWIGDAALDHQGPVFVDVGGSLGETLKSILEFVPGIPRARSFLQDRPEVINESRRFLMTSCNQTQRPASNPPVFPVRHLTEIGALVYFLRRVLHDWSDESCVTILSLIAAAMPRDNPRARVLIMDQIVSDPASSLSAATDLIMLNIGGKERTAEEFKAVVERAGLKIVHIHRGWCCRVCSGVNLWVFIGTIHRDCSQ
ncbi:O-methyltransferase-domain-containing protein, partial [Plectosphaerella plurivora]